MQKEYTVEELAAMVEDARAAGDEEDYEIFFAQYVQAINNAAKGKDTK